MLKRVENMLKFQLEQFLLRGPFYRLLVVALLIAAIAVGGGLLVFAMGTGFATPAEAIWWAFLRLTDPGYLGDDTGTLLRTVSTVVTVLGYVIFLGALVAIMTQWFHQTMNRLQAGLTPIAQRQHIVVLGWTNRTAIIIHELFHSEGRVHRFLKRIGSSGRRLRVVLLCDEDLTEVAQELRAHLGHLWGPKRFILRSGTPLRLEHLERVDFLRAAAILLPATDVASAPEVTVDASVIKTLITIADAAVDAKVGPPFAVVEILDDRKAALAKRAYPGPIEVIASDELLSRLIAQNLRHPGLSFVYAELLEHEWGNEIYLRDAADMQGARFYDLFASFAQAVPIGLVREERGRIRALLAPPPNTHIEVGDRLVMVAPDYESAAPFVGVKPSKAAPAPDSRSAAAGGSRRILILGWNHRSPVLLREIDSYVKEGAEVTVVSRLSAAEREESLARLDVRPERITLTQEEADYTSPSDLARFQPERFDSVLLIASDPTDTEAAGDARTLLGYLVLLELLSIVEHTPNILVELLDPDNMGLFARKQGEVIVSPVVVSHVLTQVALRRELRVVFEELFGARGAEIRFRHVSEVLDARAGVDFGTIQQACLRQGEVALGLQLGGAADPPGGVLLNPDRARTWSLGPADRLIVVAGA